MSAPVNTYVTRGGGGRVRAVCQCCGAMSRSHEPAKDGEADMWKLGRGWSEAPYPADFVHTDGSVGSTFTCPRCNQKLHAGHSLKLRSYLQLPQEQREVCRRVAS